MAAPDHVVLGVLQAAEVAHVGPLTLTEGEAMADALLVRFPAMAGKNPDRASWARWTTEDEARLVELWHAGTKLADVAAELGRTKGAVKGAASRLRLTRTGYQEGAR